MKKTLTSDLFFTHYNPDLEIIGANDARLYGVGACIPHKMTDGTLKPITHASRTLLLAEKNYSQIEKEALWIVFILKFHRNVHGRHFTLQTDHKPPPTIFGSKKGLQRAYSQQIAKMGYNPVKFNFKMEYLP